MAQFSLVEQTQLTAGMTDQQLYMFQTAFDARRKDRSLILVLSILLGWMGLDRFLIGDAGLGLLKLLTAGVFGIFWIIDMLLIQSRVDDLNRRLARDIAIQVRMSGPAAAYFG